MEQAAHPPRLGFGLVGRSPQAASELAPVGAELEALGYDEVWVNDGRSRSALDTLAALSPGTRQLDLCTGVTPLDERSPTWIAERVRALDLPHDRLVLGVGSGGASSLALVRDGVAELRRLLPDCRVAVSALGPRMCSLAGEVADLVLLNWAFPDRIAWARERVAEGAATAGRTPPRVAGYVRVALGPTAAGRLDEEARRYATRPRAYRALFAAVPGVAALNVGDVPEQLAPYRAALDSCVIRALPVSDDAAGWLAVARAGAGQLEGA